MSTKTIDERKLDYAKHNTSSSHADSIKVFGFWIYLMSDSILFAILFAAYAVLVNNTAGGPAGKDIFDLFYVFLETICLLFSSITNGMAILAMKYSDKHKVNLYLGLTLLCGLIFLCMEVNEFNHLIVDGMGPNRSAFLSSFFTLIATHGIHIASGILWILVMIVHIAINGLTIANKIRMHCLSLFWHFLDLIWICIFTVVYLIGALQ